MAILAFQKPEKVIMLESTSSFGKFEFRPLEPGFGMTVGNALRRILLSSLEGYAITTVKVAGVDHEFAAIPGVMEDMLKIILNLKQVRFIRTVDNQDAEKVSINVAGVILFWTQKKNRPEPCEDTRTRVGFTSFYFRTMFSEQLCRRDVCLICPTCHRER